VGVSPPAVIVRFFAVAQAGGTIALSSFVQQVPQLPSDTDVGGVQLQRRESTAVWTPLSSPSPLPLFGGSDAGRCSAGERVDSSPSEQFGCDRVSVDPIDSCAGDDEDMDAAAACDGVGAAAVVGGGDAALWRGEPLLAPPTDAAIHGSSAAAATAAAAAAAVSRAAGDAAWLSQLRRDMVTPTLAARLGVAARSSTAVPISDAMRLVDDPMAAGDAGDGLGGMASPDRNRRRKGKGAGPRGPLTCLLTKVGTRPCCGNSHVVSCSWNPCRVRRQLDTDTHLEVTRLRHFSAKGSPVPGTSARIGFSHECFCKAPHVWTSCGCCCGAWLNRDQRPAAA
jgi:hypothetical protein